MILNFCAKTIPRIPCIHNFLYTAPSKTKHFHSYWYFSTSQWVCSGGYFIWVVVVLSEWWMVLATVRAHPWIWYLDMSLLKLSPGLVCNCIASYNVNVCMYARIYWFNVCFSYRTLTMFMHIQNYIHGAILSYKGSLISLFYIFASSYIHIRYWKTITVDLCIQQ